MNRRIGALFIALCFLAIAATARGGDETCYAIPADQWAPAGTAGCTLDGPTEGVASTWSGDVAAAQWCLYPWTDCTAVRVQSHRTGLSIVVKPAMFCHCWWMTDRRLVDLTHGQVLALGLDASRGLWPVTVTPLDSKAFRASTMLPDTAVGP